MRGSISCKWLRGARTRVQMWHSWISSHRLFRPARAYASMHACGTASAAAKTSGCTAYAYSRAGFFPDRTAWNKPCKGDTIWPACSTDALAPQCIALGAGIAAVNEQACMGCHAMHPVERKIAFS